MIPLSIRYKHTLLSVILKQNACIYEKIQASSNINHEKLSHQLRVLQAQTKRYLKIEVDTLTIEFIAFLFWFYFVLY